MLSDLLKAQLEAGRDGRGGVTLPEATVQAAVAGLEAAQELLQATHPQPERTLLEVTFRTTAVLRVDVETHQVTEAKVLTPMTHRELCPDEELAELLPDIAELLAQQLWPDPRWES